MPSQESHKVKYKYYQNHRRCNVHIACYLVHSWSYTTLWKVLLSYSVDSSKAQEPEAVLSYGSNYTHTTWKDGLGTWCLYIIRELSLHHSESTRCYGVRCYFQLYFSDCHSNGEYLYATVLSVLKKRLKLGRLIALIIYLTPTHMKCGTLNGNEARREKPNIS